MKDRVLVAIVGVFIVTAVSVGVLFLQGSVPSTSDEHYQIKITGMKDAYLVGEQYDFSYIISGYGNECGSKKITFPDQNDDTMIINNMALCIANESMKNFVFNIEKHEGTTFGHVKITKPGNYAVSVEFERDGFEPTLGGHNFVVVEKICDDADSIKQAQCFSDSFDSCQSAYMTQRFSEESGVVSLRAVVESWNDCSLRVYTENSAGEHAPFNGIRSICDGVSIKNQTLNFEGCNNAQYPPITLTSQNSIDCNSNSGNPDFECFIDSFKKCAPATISITRNTIEGDPIFSSGMVTAKDDSCFLDFTIDSTQDKFSSVGVTHRICSDVYIEGRLFTFECDDGKFGIPLD